MKVRLTFNFQRPNYDYTKGYHNNNNKTGEQHDHLKAPMSDRLKMSINIIEL